MPSKPPEGWDGFHEGDLLHYTLRIHEVTDDDFQMELIPNSIWLERDGQPLATDLTKLFES
jgi:hypothetical protein